MFICRVIRSSRNKPSLDTCYIEVKENIESYEDVMSDFNLAL